MVQSSGSLSELLHLVTDKHNAGPRRDFSRFSAKVSTVFAESYVANLNQASLDRSAIEGELSAVLAMRLLWRCVPSRIFRSSAPDFEAIAKSALETEFGVRVSTEMIAMLAIVYRRLRRSHLEGRPDTRLDLSRITHRELMNDQRWQCAICRYQFPDSTYFYLDDTEDDYFSEDYSARNGELHLAKYYRRPALDHIIPYFIGGDGIENWQILCWTCNSGKGESMSWMNRRGWLPPSNIFEATQLSPSLRYSCLVVRGDKFSEAPPQKGRVLRIFKIEPEKLVYMENLRVEYC